MKYVITYTKIIAIACIMAISYQIEAQGYNIGIRAGLGQNKFIGPTEVGESYGLTGGFHFGIAFQWNFNELVGIRSEILYNQTGSSYFLDTPNGYYVFDPDRISNLNRNILIRDASQITLDHSNAYLQLPQTIHVSLGDKWELFGGGYISFLISPVATGNILFGGEVGDKEHSFRQGLNFEYFKGNDTGFFGFGAGGSDILVRANGVDVDLVAVQNSQDFNNFDISESRFLSIDYGLIVGASYYLNRGLFLMGRAEWGVRDITRNSADFSFSSINDDLTPIFPNNVDRNFGAYLSIGFKF